MKLIYIFLSFLFVWPLFANDKPDAYELWSIQEMDETLFVARVQDDLFFVMEKLDESTIPVWQEYVRRQSLTLSEEIQKLITHLAIDKSCNLKNLEGCQITWRYDPSSYDNNPYNRKISPLLLGDGGTFAVMVDQYASRWENHPTNETWIVYALSTRTAPTSHTTIETLPYIELSFTLNTDEDAPFTSHMGIQRSRLYMRNYLAEELRQYRNPLDGYVPRFPWHGNISVLLHAFGAKVILRKSAQKVYMITNPMSEMRNILVKALPQDAVWLGANVFYQELAENPRLKLGLWGSTGAKRANEIKLFGPFIDKILAKKYSPISYSGECFVDESTERGPSTWIAEGIPDDFTWTLHDLEGKKLIHFDSSSLPIIMEKYQWFFMGRNMHPGMSGPYLIVDLKKLAKEFNAR